MSMVVWLDSTSEDRGTGGKGASLIELTRAGFPVPHGFVVTTDAYSRFVQANGLQAAIETVLALPDLRQSRVARESVGALSVALAAAVIPTDAREEIVEAYTKLQEKRPAPVAVRSSALSEDGGSASSAGLYESFLNCIDVADVLDNVARCYRSLWSARAVQYRAVQGLGGHGEAMAVVVMTMAPAESAGVAFTANPVTGDRAEIVINASWGLGEAIVSGRVSPDSFIVAKADRRVTQREISPKEVEVVADPAGMGGTVLRPIAEARAMTPALTDTELDTLVGLCLAVEAHAGRPMDIEWSCSGGQFALLQARPITRLR